jgi:hypothetical protein
MDNKKRLQFDFAQPAVERLDFLVDKLNATSRAEVVRRALELLDSLLEWKNNGGEVVLKSKNGEEKYLFFV